MKRSAFNEHKRNAFSFIVLLPFFSRSPRSSCVCVCVFLCSVFSATCIATNFSPTQTKMINVYILLHLFIVRCGTSTAHVIGRIQNNVQVYLDSRVLVYLPLRNSITMSMKCLLRNQKLIETNLNFIHFKCYPINIYKRFVLIC